MSEEKNNLPVETNEINRRAFFAKLGLGSLSIAAAGTAVFAYQLLTPNVLFEPSPIVNAGRSGKLCAGFGDAGCKFRDLFDPCQRRLLFFERSLHALGLPHRVEAGAWNHRLPMPRQQVQSRGGQD